MLERNIDRKSIKNPIIISREIIIDKHRKRKTLKITKTKDHKICKLINDQLTYDRNEKTSLTMKNDKEEMKRRNDENWELKYKEENNENKKEKFFFENIWNKHNIKQW